MDSNDKSQDQPINVYEEHKDQAKAIERGFKALLEKTEDQLSEMAVEEVTHEMRRKVFKKNLKIVLNGSSGGEEREQEGMGKLVAEIGEEGVAGNGPATWSIDNFGSHMARAMKEIDELSQISQTASCEKMVDAEEQEEEALGFEAQKDNYRYQRQRHYLSSLERKAAMTERSLAESSIQASVPMQTVLDEEESTSVKQNLKIHEITQTMD